MRVLKKILFFCLVALLAACQALAPKPPAVSSNESPTTPAQTPPADLQAEYRTLAASGGTVYRINPEASKVLIYVFRGGLAAKSGHNHVISTKMFEGFVYLPSEDPAQARFDLRVPVNELVVDEPALRAETGGSFSGERSDSDKAGTRKNMLGPRGLDAEQFPIVHLKSMAVAGDWPVLVVEIAVTLHGVTRQQSVVLQVSHAATGLKAMGTLLLRQTDYGITPYSLFGGVLSVQDVVVVDFELKGSPEA